MPFITMPKVLGPLFSFTAQGNLARALNYCNIRGASVIRSIHTPNVTLTPLLREHRSFMRLSVWTWQHLTDNIPPIWNTWASNYYKHASGFNAFTCYYIRDLSDGIIPSLFPPP